MGSVIRKPLFWIGLAIVVLVGGLVTAGVVQYRKIAAELAKTQAETGGQLNEDRQRELVAEVGAKIALPADETPTVAVVSDIEKLKEQQFFSNGQNGDVVLIYMKAKKAVLYRPGEKKIIEVAPVNMSDQGASVSAASATQTTPAPTNAQSETPAELTGRIAIRNGTTITGLARTFETKLVSEFPSITISERGNANARTYQNTQIIDVSGNRAADAQRIALAMGGTIASLPAGENAPIADFLVILGQDAQ